MYSDPANKTSSRFDGLLADNTVLSALMVISPVIMCSDTLRNAEALIYAFSAITFISVILCSFVPRKLPYAVKVIIYAAIAALVYIPVKNLAQVTYPGIVSRVGIYFPLLAVNSLIVFRGESLFYGVKKARMITSLTFYILGFDAVMLVTAVIRELFTYGTFNSHMVDVSPTVSGLGMPFGGFILLGLMCGVYRKVRSALRPASDAEERKEGSDVSGN